MIQSFQYYINKKLVRKTGINPAIANSLIKKSDIRLKRIIREKIKEEESLIIFEDIYESIRESTQALMQLKGYKPYSHEALISFLKENNVFSPEIINNINRYRILRNKSVYEAKKISIETCKDALIFAKELLPKIKEKTKWVMN